MGILDRILRGSGKTPVGETPDTPAPSQAQAVGSSPTSPATIPARGPEAASQPRVVPIESQAMSLSVADRAAADVKTVATDPDTRSHERRAIGNLSEVGGVVSGGDNAGYRVGDTLRYEFAIEDILTGGMGEVYVVRHKKNLFRFAAKTFKKEFFAKLDLVELFTREARIWVGLGRHPNIVQAINVFHVDGRPFVFLEFVERGNLEAVMGRRPLAIERAMALAVQICDGMSYVHESAGLVHCDLKPLNIMVGDGGVIKVTDFGLAALVRDRRDGLAAQGAGRGTLPYMAPEQFVPDGPVCFATDIYAMGVILFRLVTGWEPFSGPAREDYFRQHTSACPPRIRPLNPIVPQQFEEIVLRCLRKDPKERYQHFRDLRENLERVASDMATELPAAARVVAEDACFTIEKGKLVAGTEQIRRFSEVYNRAVSEHELGNFEASLSLFQQALTIRPETADAWNGRANSLCRLGRCTEAEECYLRAVSLDPTMPEAWVNLGMLYCHGGSYGDALAAVDKALQASPDVPPFWAVRADVLRKMGRRSEAWDSLNRALDLNPRCANALFLRAQMLQEDGHKDEALVFLERILEVAPQDIASLRLISLLLIQKHSFSQALRHLDLLRQLLGGEDTACLKQAALCHMKLADFDDAMAIFQRLKESEPSDPDHSYNIGLCLQMLAKETEARKWYLEALSKKPDHFKACNNLGACYFDEGNRAESLRWLEKALSIEPDNEIVRQRIIFVKERLS